MAKKTRSANIKRKTTETDITGKLNIDGKGKVDINTGIGFLDHMITLFAFHGLFDLALKARGDLGVDIHHTNEDVAICLGKAFKEALGDCKSIKRFGSKEVPMDQASARVMTDIGGRYAFVWRVPPYAQSYVVRENYSLEDGKDFMSRYIQARTFTMCWRPYSRLSVWLWMKRRKSIRAVRACRRRKGESIE